MSLINNKTTQIYRLRKAKKHLIYKWGDQTKINTEIIHIQQEISHFQCQCHSIRYYRYLKLCGKFIYCMLTLTPSEMTSAKNGEKHLPNQCVIIFNVYSCVILWKPTKNVVYPHLVCIHQLNSMWQKPIKTMGKTTLHSITNSITVHQQFNKSTCCSTKLRIIVSMSTGIAIAMNLVKCRFLWFFLYLWHFSFSSRIVINLRCGIKC